MTQNTGRQTIVVRGAWTGPVTDPHRQFSGEVTESDVAGIETGQAVGVSFTGSESRVPGAREHGKYVLSLGERSLPLVSFTCDQTGKSGHAGHDDTQPAEWCAVVVQ
ncbi:hypothetical protein [Deinococcus sp. Leaf326]|uniref:hypothetical protein n=1 Tax=Deinococcus sp. Leaf326 TaxID=1736338 RepID=UPI0006F6FFF4|nr:hypothetical protein [Deinococcus sp. Leaf326]KQQ99344.1 hypothetical protein ASF71_13210 [Deinococcus sp. Leaf326]